MKKSRLSVDCSEGFVLGLAIDAKEIQFGLMFWLLILKFKA